MIDFLISLLELPVLFIGLLQLSFSDSGQFFAESYLLGVLNSFFRSFRAG